jgi:hypothetical protein
MLQGWDTAAGINTLQFFIAALQFMRACDPSAACTGWVVLGGGVCFLSVATLPGCSWLQQLRVASSCAAQASLVEDGPVAPSAGPVSGQSPQCLNV